MSMEKQETSAVGRTTAISEEDVMSEASIKTAVIIQHVLPKFAKRDDGSVCFDQDELVAGVKGWVERNKPSEVIVTYEFNESEVDPQLRQIATQVVKWKWVADFNEDSATIAQQLGVPDGDFVRTYARGDFCSPIYGWMKDLRGYSVKIMGGFYDECLQGLADGLDKLDIDYKRHSSLIY